MFDMMLCLTFDLMVGLMFDLMFDLMVGLMMYLLFGCLFFAGHSHSKAVVYCRGTRELDTASLAPLTDLQNFQWAFAVVIVVTVVSTNQLVVSTDAMQKTDSSHQASCGATK